MTETPGTAPQVAELEDFFEGGGGGYPTFSLATEKIGTKFGGYVLPVSAEEPNKTHITTAQTNTEGVVQYWPQRPGENVLRPRPQAEINLMTEYREREFMSENAVKRAVENDQADNGLRRWIVKGKSATDGLKAELRRLGINRAAPAPGSFVEVTLIDRKANTKGKENIWTVKVTAPDDKGRQVVANYLAMLAEQADPEGTGGTTPDTEEPPF
jgi:hypothetical protein